MKQTFFHIFSTVGVVLALMLAGCTAEGNPNQEAAPNPTAKMSPAARERMEQREEDALKKQSMSQDEVENKMSPYRYVVSTELHSIFGQLVKQSTLAKHIHGRGVTLLAPTNKAMEAMGDWKLLTRQAYRAELDEFVGHTCLPIQPLLREIQDQRQPRMLGRPNPPRECARRHHHQRRPGAQRRRDHLQRHGTRLGRCGDDPVVLALNQTTLTPLGRF